jgi:hypothetical protein
MLRCTARIDAGRILIIVLCIVVCRFEVLFTCSVVGESVWWSGPVRHCCWSRLCIRWNQQRGSREVVYLRTDW